MSRFQTTAKKKLDPKNLSFVILAAGECKRYRTKSLFKINNQTLIEYQINEIREAFGPIDIVVNLGYELETIYKYIPKGVRVVENVNYLNNTSATSLLQALRVCVTDNIYIVHGDILFDRNTLQLAVPETHTFGVPLDKDSGGKVGIIEQGGEVKQLQYGLPTRWEQMILLTKSDIDKYKIAFNQKKETHPQLFEILNEMIASGTKIKYIQAQLKEVNSGKDLL